MNVVSDSSPLHYLVLIGKVDLLHLLFGSIIIPRSVQQELIFAAAPIVVREWFSKLPPWANVRAAATVDESLPLGKGEREAICLATELHADVLLLDDKKARRIAQGRELAVAGTLAIVRAAHDRGLVRLPEIIRSLRDCGFRVSEKLAQQICSEIPDSRGATTSPHHPPT